jgi:hypothetical protein
VCLLSGHSSAYRRVHYGGFTDRNVQGATALFYETCEGQQEKSPEHTRISPPSWSAPERMDRRCYAGHGFGPGRGDSDDGPLTGDTRDS